MIKPVLLWTDAAIWLLMAGLALYCFGLRRQATQAATWGRVLRDPVGVAAGALLALFLLVTLADSVHYRVALDAGPAGQTVYDTHARSLLDALMQRQLAMRETSYSAPLAWRGFSREASGDVGMLPGQAVARAFPRLAFGGAALADPARDWAGDVVRRALWGLFGGALAAALLFAAIAARLAATHGGWRLAARDLAADRTVHPLRALWLTLACVCLLLGPTLALMPAYHVLGTDRTGNDVLYQSLKSVRTAFVIGALSTLATLPFALGLGVLAGYFRGWIDDAIQYLYTLLASVPNVLLIAACVLMVQVFLDQNPQLFETAAERGDLKMFLLCAVLGITGWSGLCRLVRAETLKLRELDYVQAATAFGVSPWRIMRRHIVPNLMHLVLITAVLNFSDLILYEAVLTYVGVGVDPTTTSFGGMINLARLEMSRDPLVWWSFAAAFGFMVALVLAANLFADAVRDAFDPRARAQRPWHRRHKAVPPC
ncbi:MAG: ABC transporter permease [Pelomonas sp.]|nr:ABC transporter permease [Roseateles sp.]